MKYRFWIIAILILSVGVFIYSTVRSVDAVDCEAVVSTRFGPLKGRCSKVADVCVWRDITYAAPPVGELRFKPPVDPEPWEEVYWARKYGPPCCQKVSRLELNPFKTGLFVGYEECLTLNVWRPRKQDKFPVMVWIHGGTLLTGSGSLPTYRGDWLADKHNVVLVTINYRLGPLGFLSHRDLAAEDPNGSSGNYGLLDQIKALEWVKNNIAAFGGDPENVTIFGESAGGRSVCALLASPLAKGLFHRAIMESGGCDNIVTLEEGFDYGDKLVKDLDCEEGEEIECLREKSAQAIFREIPWDETGETSPFKFHLDGYALTDQPMDAFKKGTYNRVPFLAGSNRDELRLMRYFSWRSRRWNSDQVKEGLRELYGEDAVNKVLELYPIGNYEKPADALFATVGDSRFGCSAFRIAEVMSASNSDIYLYRFDYDNTRFSKLGAFHGLEVPFIFGTFNQRPFKLIFKKEQIVGARPLSDAMGKYWTKFASTGDPNTEGAPQWPKYDTQSRQFIVLDSEIRIESFERGCKCDFWKEYYEKKQ